MPQSISKEEKPEPEPKADLHPKKVMHSLWIQVHGVVQFEQLPVRANNTSRTAINWRNSLQTQRTQKCILFSRQCKATQSADAIEYTRVRMRAATQPGIFNMLYNYSITLYYATHPRITKLKLSEMITVFILLQWFSIEFSIILSLVQINFLY